jgi:hypothetical protein
MIRIKGKGFMGYLKRFIVRVNRFAFGGPMKRNKTLDPNLSKHPRLGLQLSSEDQAALVAFLKTLTDPKYLEMQN